MRFDKEYIEHMLDQETETSVGIKVLILSLAEAVETLEGQVEQLTENLGELAGPKWREHWDADHGTTRPMSVHG